MLNILSCDLIYGRALSQGPWHPLQNDCNILHPHRTVQAEIIHPQKGFKMTENQGKTLETPLLNEFQVYKPKHNTILKTVTTGNNFAHNNRTTNN